MTRSIATTTRQASKEIRDILQSLLVIELLKPPDRLWLVSAWVTDAFVLDNRGGELTSLVPSWPEREIRLSEVFSEFLASGTRIALATNDHHANRAFNDALRGAAGAVGATRSLKIEPLSNVGVEAESNMHRKRLMTDRFVIWGSMNFTYSGLERNAEDVSVATDPAIVAGAVNEMQQLHPIDS